MKCDRVAVALWRLANGSYFRTRSKTLAVAKSTTVEIANSFCKVLSRYERFIINFLVNRRNPAEAIAKFRKSRNSIIPQAVGVIDATHVPILVLDRDSKLDYFSRKQEYSINIYSVFGNKLEFLSVPIGYPKHKFCEKYTFISNS